MNVFDDNSLTIGKTPAGIQPAKTEFLDDSQVDRLTLENIPSAKKKKKKRRRRKKAKTKSDASSDEGSAEKSAKKPKRPMGLKPQKTEFLDEDEVDALSLDD